MAEAIPDLGPDLDPRVFDSETFQKDPFPVYKQLRDPFETYSEAP